MTIFITAAILICILWLLHYRQGQKTQTLQKQGLQNLIMVKQLIVNVQQHRGLSSAYLNGDLSKQQSMTQSKKQINLLIGSIEQSWIGSINERWSSFSDHWQRLINTHNKTSVLDNFKQHTKMISNLIFLLEDLAEYSDLNAEHLSDLPNIGLVWRELVVATESVGQSRAIGTGIATQGVCSQVDKIRLSYLQQDILDTRKTVLNNLPQLTNNYNQSTLIKAADQKLSELCQTIDKELLQAKKVVIDSNAYFNLATSTIEALNNIFDNQLGQVKQVLKLA